MIIIGEKLNASIPKTKKAIEQRSAEALRTLARQQVEAGSDYLDVNVGTGKDEIATMKWLVGEIEDETQVPLSIDTADVNVLAAGLEATGQDQVLVNSIDCEESRLKKFLPLVKDHEAEVIGLAISGSGVPVGPDERLRNCETIAEACASEGIPLSRVFFDPLLTPQCTDPSQATVSLETIRRIKAEFPDAKVSIGLSNMSFGLPMRRLIHATFIPLAMFAGVDAAILSPLDKKLMSTIKTTEMLLGRDRRCKTYVKSYRADQLTF